MDVPKFPARNVITSKNLYDTYIYTFIHVRTEKHASAYKKAIDHNRGAVARCINKEHQPPPPPQTINQECRERLLVDTMLSTAAAATTTTRWADTHHQSDLHTTPPRARLKNLQSGPNCQTWTQNSRQANLGHESA